MASLCVPRQRHLWRFDIASAVDHSIYVVTYQVVAMKTVVNGVWQTSVRRDLTLSNLYTIYTMERRRLGLALPQTSGENHNPNHLLCTHRFIIFNNTKLSMDKFYRAYEIDFYKPPHHYNSFDNTFNSKVSEEIRKILIMLLKHTQ